MIIQYHSNAILNHYIYKYNTLIYVFVRGVPTQYKHNRSSLIVLVNSISITLSLLYMQDGLTSIESSKSMLQFQGPSRPGVGVQIT